MNSMNGMNKMNEINHGQDHDHGQEHGPNHRPTENRMKILVPVSYMGSGSSALTDLLAEYKGIHAPHDDFEYVFLHCPNGLFDLEDKLLQGNTALRSDEALHSFLNRMQQLSTNKWWVAHYQEKIGPHFTKACQDFVAALIDARPDFYWYEQEQNKAWMYPKLIFNKILKSLSRGKIKTRRPLTHPEIWLSWPEEAEFYAKAQQFLNDVFLPMFERFQACSHLVFDQLLLPHHLHRLENYFPTNRKEGIKLQALVINRDPRDVFLSNKYFWSKQNVPLPYPIDVKAFCLMYGKLRRAEKPASSPSILRLQFEDLIYRYEETCSKVEAFLQVDASQHVEPKSRFNPQRSIQNTQLFMAHEAWEKEAKIIQKELSQYCYDFPYAYEHQERQVF